MSLLACIGLFAAVVATWIAISGPGEAALVSAGTVAARGEDGIAAVLVIAFLGTFAGSVAAYWLGRAGGRRLLLRRGPLLAWRSRLLARSEGLIRRRAFIASPSSPAPRRSRSTTTSAGGRRSPRSSPPARPLSSSSCAAPARA